MRLGRLDLIRYGKFTDTTIELPRSQYDFHLIVGPNEAGKSTIRTAVAELLFGMPLRSPMGFVHPLPDLRVGAIIEAASGQLEFHRTKSTKTPLTSPAGATLPEDALAHYLGAADRQFFEQMFGLDHAQLVKGGRSILDASDNVGQVLFQSAAGIASLGKVRDALAEEAGKLWGPRKASDRAYYMAAAALEAAERELKEATVRTRVWTEARSAFDAAESKLKEIGESLRELEKTRTRLERVRRLSPFVQTMRAKSAELNELGEVIDLPADASQTLNDGQQALAVAEELLRQRESDIATLEAARDAIEYDAAILTHRQEIEALEAFRHRIRDHARDLVLRQGEVNQLLGQVREACAELGWPADEDQVRAAMPSTIALKTVGRLLKGRGALQQAKATSQKAVADKRREVNALEGELAAAPETVIPPELRAALVEAQALRNTATTQQGLATALEGTERALSDALAALGKWTRPIEALKTMTLPSSERLASLIGERARLEAEVKTARDRADEAENAVSEARLAVEQYEAVQRIVTVDEVRAARARRDATWGKIKSCATSIRAGSAELDSEIALADQLVDTQLGSATAAAELQSLRQRATREEISASRAQTALDEKKGELLGFDDAWASEAAALTLEGLPLGDASAWLARRDAAISAAAAVAQKKSELTREQTAASTVLTSLSQRLHEADHPFDGNSVAAACAAAERFIRDADSAYERRQGLSRQIEQARQALDGLVDDAKAASDAYDTWETEWLGALMAAKLGTMVKTPDEAEAALELVARINDGLNKAAAIRRDRIDTMNRDLAQFAELAAAIAAKLDPSAAKPDDAEQYSKEVGARLLSATSAYERWLAADKSLSAARVQRDAAQTEVNAATARVKPLLAAGGVSSLAEVLPLVGRSDRRRQLQQAIDGARTTIMADTDGLGIDAVVAELDAADLSTLPGQLADVSRELEEVRSQWAAATEERLRAQQTFDGISGSATAAIAEAKRQEALAAMAEASERYVKVATASRLLRWATDKYRDRKQGPMLSRAGEIFARLTLGWYKKLVVDYDHEPPSLAAQRAAGATVEVSGMSEGTRDQLFLALRLAALELHLAQTTPLPFIADDLFINFDDDRSKAGLEALRELSKQTQVIFLSHHDHLLPIVQDVFGVSVNVVILKQ